MKELWNKSLLKFSPLLKSVAALPCETWNVRGESRTPLIYRALCAGALSSCPVGIWNCHPIFPLCMATASLSAVLHDNSRRSLSLQVAQFHIPIWQHTCVQGTWHNRTFTPRDARLHFSRPVALKQPRYVPLWLWDLGCNATAGLRETHKWRRRVALAPVECVAQHRTKRHRRSDGSVACSTHRLCTSKRRSFWAPDVR